MIPTHDLQDQDKASWLERVNKWLTRVLTTISGAPPDVTMLKEATTRYANKTKRMEENLKTKKEEYRLGQIIAKNKRRQAEIKEEMKTLERRKLQ